MDLEIVVEDERATRRLGGWLAGRLRSGDLLLLEGDLGAGKTALTRALLRGLGLPPDEPVTSPTFALVNDYDTQPPVLHADLYRLTDPDEIADLLLLDALASGAIVIVEWGLRFMDALLPPLLIITIEYDCETDASPEERRMRFHAEAPRGVALLQDLGQAWKSASDEASDEP